MTIGFQSALVALATALGSAFLSFLLIRVSPALRLVAEARIDRWHTKATPNTGGIAIALSCAVACALVVGEGPCRSIIGVGAALAVFGVIDDRYRLRPLTKLAGQALAAAIAISQGAVFRLTHVEAINLAITFVWIVGITNAFNLIDNMDGLCAGVTIVIACFRFVAALQTGDADAALTLAILAGAYGGFLVFNHSPAKIFMGDSGSLFAGFVLAAVAVTGPVPRTRLFLSGLLYPTLTFLYPIFDTALVSILRRLAGRPISVGGRDHSSHRLVSLGITERHAVWLLWGLTAAGSAVGLVSSWMPVGVIAVATLLLLCTTLFGIFLGNLSAFEIPTAASIRSHRIRRLIPTLRAGITLIVDVLLAGVALLCAFLLRWENSFVGAPVRELMFSLPIVCVCHGLACLVFRSFQCGWRWFGISDLLALSKCVVAECALYTLVLWTTGAREYSGGVVLLYAVLALSFAAGMRLFMRLLTELSVKQPHGERVAVLGASEASELAILICQKRGLDVHPVIILESDPAASQISVHGVKVRSASADPVRILEEVHVRVLLVPSSLELAAADREIVQRCELAGIHVLRLDLSITPIRSVQTVHGHPALVSSIPGLPAVTS